MKLIPRIIVLSSLLFSLACQAASVWQVSKNDKHFYLAGTVHLLSADDYPLPTAYDTAYNNSQHLLFETDLAALTSPEGLNDLLQKNSYPAGQSLKTAMSASGYQALQQYCQDNAIPLAQIEQFKPAFAAMLLTTFELQKRNAAQDGVDAVYQQKAIADNKRYAGLETTAEHIGVLTALNKLEADNLILTTINDLSKLDQQLNQMKTAWRSGDAEQLTTLFVEDLKRTPQIYDIMLKKRNHAWLPQLEKLTKHTETTMVLVGALHLAGEDGLLKLLQAKGFHIQQLAE